MEHLTVERMKEMLSEMDIARCVTVEGLKYKIIEHLRETVQKEIQIYVHGNILPQGTYIFRDTSFLEDSDNLNLSRETTLDKLADDIIVGFLYVSLIQFRFWDNSNKKTSCSPLGKPNKIQYSLYEVANNIADLLSPEKELSKNTTDTGNQNAASADTYKYFFVNPNDSTLDSISTEISNIKRKILNCRGIGKCIDPKSGKPMLKRILAHERNIIIDTIINSSENLLSIMETKNILNTDSVPSDVLLKAYERYHQLYLSCKNETDDFSYITRWLEIYDYESNYHFSFASIFAELLTKFSHKYTDESDDYKKAVRTCLYLLCRNRHIKYTYDGINYKDLHLSTAYIHIASFHTYLSVDNSRESTIHWLNTITPRLLYYRFLFEECIEFLKEELLCRDMSRDSVMLRFWNRNPLAEKEITDFLKNKHPLLSDHFDVERTSEKYSREKRKVQRSRRDVSIHNLREIMNIVYPKSPLWKYEAALAAIKKSHNKDRLPDPTELLELGYIIYGELPEN